MMNQNDYKVVAERLCSLSDAYAKASWWRRITIAGDIAEVVWYRMPMIYSALIHHVEGMKAQQS